MGANIRGLLAEQKKMHAEIQQVALQSSKEKALHDSAMQLVASIK